MKKHPQQLVMRRFGDSLHHQITTSPNHQIAFTLTELLVVIGIIALLMTVGLPSIKAMFASSTLDAAYTLVSSSVSAARTYGPRERIISGDPNITYRGAAAVFIRNTDGQIEIHITQHRSCQDASSGSTAHQCVYRDVLEPIVLGENVGIVGISRTSSGTVLIAPPPPTSPPIPSGSGYNTSDPGPFAIRFDPNGVLIARRGDTTSAETVYYNVNPTTTTSSHNRPLNSVVGVVVYDAKAFADANYSISGTSDYQLAESTAEYNWIMNNGTPMLFNRYTGAVMREQ